MGFAGRIVVIEAITTNSTAVNTVRTTKFRENRHDFSCGARTSH
jgi:hypothetical protein